jgi:hypothetical protein
MNMLLGLNEELLPVQRLRHNRVWPPQTGCSNEEIIILHGDLFGGLVEDASLLRGAIDFRNAALHKAYVGNLQGRDVLEADPGLGGVVGRREGER